MSSSGHVNHIKENDLASKICLNKNDEINNLIQEQILEIESLKVSSNNNTIKNKNNINFQNDLNKKYQKFFIFTQKLLLWN